MSKDFIWEVDRHNEYVTVILKLLHSTFVWATVCDKVLIIDVWEIYLSILCLCRLLSLQISLLLLFAIERCVNLFIGWAFQIYILNDRCSICFKFFHFQRQRKFWYTKKIIYIYIYMYMRMYVMQWKINNEFKYSLLLVCRRCPSVNDYFYLGILV